jgi:hypothetical protein
MRVHEIRRFWLRRRRVRHQKRKHPIPKHPQTRQVSWYRVVVEVGLHDRLEPSTGLGHGIVSVSTRFYQASSSEMFGAAE